MSMHLEILVEDQSGKEALDIIIPKIISEGTTFKTTSYRGIGHIPKNLNAKQDARKRVLLNNLPRLIRGLGKTFSGYPGGYSAALIVVCDLDDRNLVEFEDDLRKVLYSCNPRPSTLFCIAIEEGEAWLLGDTEAVECAYERANRVVLSQYVNDSICGTWETLADAVYPGGHVKLKKKGWQAVGTEKSKWAKSICPFIDPPRNRSPSFNNFVDSVRKIENDCDKGVY